MNFKILFFYIIFFISGLPLQAQRNLYPEWYTLKDNWEFRVANVPDSIKLETQIPWTNAVVPGTVHTDLFKNKIIPDPYYRDNERHLQWIERCDWEYRTTFNLKESTYNQTNIEILLEGLDTYADVYVNDSLVLKAKNMFVDHAAAIKKFVRKGENKLRIYFHSPVVVGMEKLRKLGYNVPAVNELAPIGQRSSVFTRKAPFHYGWDWGPRFVTSGIWKPVHIKAWSNARIEDLFVQQKYHTMGNVDLKCSAEIISDKSKGLVVAMLINGVPSATKNIQVQQGKSLISFDARISKPTYWWSHGLGKPYLYNITLLLKDNGKTIDTLYQHLGVRTVEWVQTPDTAGSSFYCKLNGIPVFMKGANYIPADNFIPEVGESRYKKVIQGAVDANMNSLRVWGGAVYESDMFYDLCDKNGILIWQDFMFACSMIPPGQEHMENLQNEFESNIKRLRRHPSLVLYCGNNENAVGWFTWNWKRDYKYSTRDSLELLNVYRKVEEEIMPNAIAKYDSSRFFWPSSPASGRKYTDLPNNKAGDLHDWQVWFGNKPFEDYERTVGRFVSEYGIQSFPEMRTVKSFSIEEDWAFRSPLFEYKQRSNLGWIAPGMNGNGMIAEYAKRYYKVPENFEHFVYVSQLTQALCFQMAIETHRRRMPYCMGSMYWQLDDCWPTVSWSSMDYYYRWKASHYAVRKANEEVILSPRIAKDTMVVMVVSDRLKNFQGVLETKVMDLSGKIITQNSKSLMVNGNKSDIAYRQDVKLLTKNMDKSNLVFVISLKENNAEMANNISYFVLPKDLNLQAAKPEVKISYSNGAYNFNIQSTSLLKNLYIQAGNNDGFFSDNFVDVIPGMLRTIKFTSDVKNLTAKDFTFISLKDTYQ